MILIIFIVQFFKDVRNKLLKEVFRFRLNRPMMRYREIDLISELIEKLNPVRVLEWGSGYSTLYFPKKLSKEANWLAIEHNEPWSSRINNKNKNPNVEIIWIEPENSMWNDEYNDGTYDDLKSYIEYPTQKGTYDLIIVDGRARKACIIKAKEILNENGILIIHDANREWYHRELEEFKYCEYFLDYRTTSGGIAIVSEGKEIGSVLNIEKRKKLLNFYNSKVSAFFGL